MGLAPLHGFLQQHKRIALDTSVFIYQLEANPRYAGLTDQIFSWIEQSRSTAITSTITMTELLVQPYRDSQEQRADEIYALLSTYPNLEWVAPTLEIADTAARIRAAYRLRTPDALQAATALNRAAGCFITNDAAFKHLNRLEVILLDRLDS